MTAIYRNEHQAIARAISVDRVTTMKPSSWQAEYRSGFVDELTSNPEPLEHLTTIEKIGQYSSTRSLVKRKTDHMIFLALVAKYATEEKDRATAVNELAGMMDSPAPEKMRRILVWMWACEAFRRGVRERLMETDGHARSTVYRWRKALHTQLDNLERAAEAIMSPELLERGLTEAA